MISFFDVDSYPSSVAIGDFNNDLELDIAVANYGMDSIEVFLGDGNGSFTAQKIYSTGVHSSPSGVAVADMNNDNLLDIVVANHGTHNVGIFFGYGNGIFASLKTHSTGSSRPQSIAIGDFNDDSRKDIAIVNSDTNSINILLGHGDGSFQLLVIYTVGFDSFPYSIVVGDLNNDHRLDIVVSNAGVSTIVILLGFGNGTFVIKQIYSTGHNAHPYSISIGDFNQDFNLDIVVANSIADNIVVFLGYGNGTFSNPKLHAIHSGSYPQYVITGDFDDDHRLDIALANTGTNTVSVLLGYGNGSFAKESIVSTGFNATPFSLAAGHVNKDQRLDIIVVNKNGNNIGILFGYGLIPFDRIIGYSFEKFSDASAIGVGDFNNDNELDIVVVFSLSDMIGVLQGHGDGTFTSLATYGTGSDPSHYSLAIGDLNRDNKLDLVVGNFISNSIGILLGYGNGTFTKQNIYSTGLNSSPKSIALGDFNNDTLLDIVVANSDGDTICIFLGHGDGTVGNHTEYPTGVGSRPFAVTIGDFNNDRQLDIVVCTSGTNNIGIMLGYRNGTFERMTQYSCGDEAFPMSVVVDDFNKDNFYDIVVANKGTSNIGIFLGYGNGSFAPIVTYSTGDDSQPISLTIGDFNNDAKLDVFVACYSPSIINIFIGYGDGTFARQVTYSINQSLLYSIALGDFNHDNQIDTVVAANDNIGVCIAIGYYHVEYAPQITYSTGSGSHPYSIAIGDFDQDNLADIAVVNFGTNLIDIILQSTNVTSTRLISYSTGLGPRHIIVADFDDDDQLDIFVANSIDNSITILFQYENNTFRMKQTLRSIEDGSSPASLAIGDLNNDKRLDIIVANEGTNTIGTYIGFDYVMLKPLHNSSIDADSFPATVSIADFNNDSQLDLIVVNNNASNVGIFLGFGNGSFGPMIAYSTGNFSFPTSVAIGDFNNDSRPDFVVTNSRTYNIGVFFGYGDGTFSLPVFYSTGDASRPVWVAVNDLNNDLQLDIVVANQWTANIGILFGHGNGTFSSMVFYSSGNDSSPCSITIGDFNKDRLMDIAVANSGINKLGILFGAGNERFQSIVTYSTEETAYTYAIATGDLNDDDQLDIVLTDRFNDNVIIFLGFGNGTFQLTTRLVTGSGSSPFSVTIVDVNSDGSVDIVVSLSETSQLGIFHRYGTNNFVPIITYPTGISSRPVGLVIGDFNNDDNLDIAITNTDSNSINIFLGFRNRSFLMETTISVGVDSYPRSVVVGDLNNDDRLDIVVAKFQSSNIGILFGYGNGIFENTRDYSTGKHSSPCSLGIGDFNNDHKMDIVVANSASDNIGIFFGIENGTFSIITTYSTSDGSQPVYVGLGDLNSDNLLDIIVANAGTNSVGIFLGHENGTFIKNTSYSMGYNSRPYFVAIGDINNDQKSDISVANFGTNTIGFLLKLC